MGRDALSADYPTRHRKSDDNHGRSGKGSTVAAVWSCVSGRCDDIGQWPWWWCAAVQPPSRRAAAQLSTFCPGLRKVSPPFSPVIDVNRGGAGSPARHPGPVTASHATAHPLGLAQTTSTPNTIGLAWWLQTYVLIGRSIGLPQVFGGSVG